MELGSSWIDLSSTEHPYQSLPLRIPPTNDPYERNVPSLLASIGALAKKLSEGLGEREGLRFPSTIEGQVYSSGDIARVFRICNNSTAPRDYTFLFNRIIATAKRKGSEAFHIDFIGDDESKIFEALPDLKLYQEFIITTLSSTGNVVVFLVLPTKSTIETFCTTPIQLNEIQVNVEKLLGILHKSFGRSFSIKRRLHISARFYNDTCFAALFLAYALQRRGDYLSASQGSILQLKLWTVSTFIRVHDHYLGSLRIKDISEETFPFYTTAFKGHDNFRQVERNGWHVMDVDGDGNCGYYSLLLGLHNVGIMSFHIDTTGDATQERRRRWQKQSIQLRQRLRSASLVLLEEVYPVGHPGRLLSWWIDGIGAPYDDDKEKLTDAFLIPKNTDMSRYFVSSFKTKPTMIFHHMDPYWASLCAAFSFKVRVVVITRHASPIQKAKGKNKKKKETDMENEDEIDVDTEGSHVYSTKIFNLHDEFPQNADEYNPYSYHDGVYRLSDAEFRSKKTIELLYMTGFKKKNKLATNHFLFLRRAYCDGISTDISVNQQTLQEFLISQEASHPPSGDSPPNISPTIMPEDSEQPVPMEMDNTPPATAEPPTISPTIMPDGPQQPVMMETDNTPPVTNERLPIAPVRTGKQFSPSKGKRGKQVGKDSQKTVSKKHQQSKASKKVRRAKASTVEVPPLAEHGPPGDDQKEEDNYDYMYDAKTGHYYKAQFNNKLKRYLDRVMVPTISDVDPAIMKEAQDRPNTWVSPTIGDPWDGPPPAHLSTKVKTLYEQHNNPFCLSYSLASALFYCGFRSAGERLYSAAKDLANLKMNRQLETIIGFMPNNVPPIGEATFFGKRTSGNHRKKRQMTWTDLFTDITPYPTLVIPARSNGRMNHAFCVVDDLIFDASTPYALKLAMESIKWIFDDDDVDIYLALRFNKKTSPEGMKLKAKYTRKVIYHWDPSSLPSARPSHLVNKAYDVEWTTQEEPGIDKPFLDKFFGMDIGR